MQKQDFILNLIKPAILMVIFGLFHSLAAQESVKDKVGRLLSHFFVDHFYRAIYCLVSLYLFYCVFIPSFYMENLSWNSLLFEMSIELRVLFYLFRLLGLVVTYFAFLQFDYFQFLGISQAWLGIKKMLGQSVEHLNLEGEIKSNPGVNEIFDSAGIYLYIRHPMLTGGFLLFAFREPTLNNIAQTTMYFVYMLVGGYYEERRLVKNLGERYLSYQRNVGAFFPRVGRLKSARFFSSL